MIEKLIAWREALKNQRMRHHLKDDAFDFLFEHQSDVCVCFDCETTGLDTKKDKIISLSAIKIKQDEILTSDSLNLVINQASAIPSESIEVHQIRNVDVSNSQYLYENETDAIEAFCHFIGGATLVGYFIQFDVAMVNQVLKPHLGIELPNPKIEVGNLYYEYAKRKCMRSCIEPNIDLSFAAILKALELPSLDKHDAFNDALMTALIYLKLKTLV